MYKMREISHFIHRLSDSIFRIIRKKREFINADPQSATTKSSDMTYNVFGGMLNHALFILPELEPQLSLTPTLTLITDTKTTTFD